MPGDARATRRPASAGRPSGRAELHAPAAHAAAGHATGGHAPVAGAPAPAQDPAELPTRAVATSPAVGFYRPRPDLAAGARVRAGDRLGSIDVLGVPQELVAPADGLVGASLVDPGDPVEYGQDVVEIELLAAPAAPHGEAG
jgi:biotin carboxyl carrier protein